MRELLKPSVTLQSPRGGSSVERQTETDPEGGVTNAEFNDQPTQEGGQQRQQRQGKGKQMCSLE